MSTVKADIQRAVDGLAGELEEPLAHAGMAAAARTMAMTTYDLLADPARIRAAKGEFARG